MNVFDFICEVGKSSFDIYLLSVTVIPHIALHETFCPNVLFLKWKNADNTSFTEFNSSPGSLVKIDLFVYLDDLFGFSVSIFVQVEACPFVTSQSFSSYSRVWTWTAITVTTVLWPYPTAVNLWSGQSLKSPFLLANNRYDWIHPSVCLFVRTLIELHIIYRIALFL